MKIIDLLYLLKLAKINNVILEFNTYDEYLEFKTTKIETTIQDAINYCYSKGLEDYFVSVYDFLTSRLVSIVCYEDF